jgi:ABC-type transport system involved in multi-copper enzyme maturation permease subunit
MKYLAILRDSFREAVDSKVIYVLVTLSLLVTLFMLSMSFTPLPADEVLGPKQMGGGRLTPAGKGDRSQREEGPVVKGDKDEQFKKPVHVPQSGSRPIGVEPLEGGAPDSPDSKYRITLLLDMHDKVTAERARESFALQEKELRRLMGLDQAEEFGVIKVTGVRVVRRAEDNRFAREVTPREQEEGVFIEIDTAPTPATRKVWPHEVKLFFGALPLTFTRGMPLGLGLYVMMTIYLWVGSLVTMLISVVITAFFIPNMLRKGTVDLLIVKPIHRWALLVYKYIGGLTFVFLNTAVALLGAWLALGLRSGVWANSFLLMIFVYTFFFAILYAISTLAAVLTRSAIVSILITCGAWFVFFILGTIHGFFDNMRQLEAQQSPSDHTWRDNTFGNVIRAIHFVSPRTGELDALGSKLLLADFLTDKLAEHIALREIHWGETVGVSLAYIVLFVGLSCWWFSTKDY